MFVHFRLHVLILEGLFRRCRRIDAESVFGEVAAVGGHQAGGCFLFPKQLGHPGDGVHHIVVQRPAGEGETACYGQRAVLTQADLPGAHLDRDGKAAVDIHQIHLCG